MEETLVVLANKWTLPDPEAFSDRMYKCPLDREGMI